MVWLMLAVAGCSCSAHLGQVLLHNLWAVVDSEDDVGDTGGGEGLNLVEDHALVAELDEGLGEGEGLPTGPC